MATLSSAAPMLSGEVARSRETDPEAVMERIIAPMSLDTFFSDFFEKKTCLFSRNQPEYFSDLLSISEIDRALTTMNLSPPTVNVVRADTDRVDRSEYVRRGVVDPIKIYKLFAEGATIILPSLHKRNPALGNLCNGLRTYLSAKMQTNIYMTPGGAAQGFRPHYDSHDVFILQVTGTKAWRIYDEKIALPLKGQGFKKDEHVAGDISMEFLLHPGDTLYIPRGVMHSAVSTDDTSLHITTGLMGFTWTQFFLDTVSGVALDDVAFRAHLPVGFANGDYDREEGRAIFKDMLQRLLERADFDKTLDSFIEDLVASQRPVLRGMLEQLARLGELSPDTRIVSRQDSLRRLVESEEAITIYFSGREVAFPLGAAEAVRFAIEEPSFLVRDLPDCVDEASKLVLVRRMIREGLLLMEF